MATAQDLANEIYRRVGSSSLGAWRVGLTHDLGERKAHWQSQGDCTHWCAWQCESLGDAQAIESHFIERGMKGGTGGNLSPHKAVYVYIF